MESENKNPNIFIAINSQIQGVNIGKNINSSNSDYSQGDSNRKSSTNINLVFELDLQMNKRKDELDKVSFEVQEFCLKHPSEGTKPQEGMLGILDSKIETATENYLNSIDSLCQEILKDIISDKYFKIKYRNMLLDTIRNIPKKFMAGTPYRNIVKLNDKWQDE